MATKVDDRLTETVVAWPQRARKFLEEVRTEMRKVTTPSGKEVRATTLVVIITVFIFAAYFFLIDMVMGYGIEKFLNWARTL